MRRKYSDCKANWNACAFSMECPQKSKGLTTNYPMVKHPPQ